MCILKENHIAVVWLFCSPIGVARCSYIYQCARTKHIAHSWYSIFNIYTVSSYRACFFSHSAVCVRWQRQSAHIRVDVYILIYIYIQVVFSFTWANKQMAMSGDDVWQSCPHLHVWNIFLICWQGCRCCLFIIWFWWTVIVIMDFWLAGLDYFTISSFFSFWYNNKKKRKNKKYNNFFLRSRW